MKHPKKRSRGWGRHDADSSGDREVARGARRPGRALRAAASRRRSAAVVADRARRVHVLAEDTESMVRHRYFILISLLALATPASAETCPVKHPALTALDHASMLAAYTASFRGIFGRNPTLPAGTGAADANSRTAVSERYGACYSTV